MENEKFIPLKFIEKRADEMVAVSQDFYNSIKDRRTVREFSDRPVPDEGQGPVPARGQARPGRVLDAAAEGGL